MSKYNKILADINEGVFAVCLNHMTVTRGASGQVTGVTCSIRPEVGDNPTIIIPPGSPRPSSDLESDVKRIIDLTLCQHAKLRSKIKEKIAQAIADSPKYVKWLYEFNRISDSTTITQAHWTNTPAAWRLATSEEHHSNPSDVLIQFYDSQSVVARSQLGLSLKSTFRNKEIGLYNGSICSFVGCVVYGEDTEVKDTICPKGISSPTPTYRDIVYGLLTNYNNFTQELYHRYHEGPVNKKRLNETLRELQNSPRPEENLAYTMVNIEKLGILNKLRDDIIVKVIKTRWGLGGTYGDTKYINTHLPYDQASHIIAGMLRLVHGKLFTENYTKLTSFGRTYNRPPLMEQSTLGDYIKPATHCSIILEKIETGRSAGVSFMIKFGKAGVIDKWKKGFRIRVKAESRAGSAVKIDGVGWSSKQTQSKPRQRTRAKSKKRRTPKYSSTAAPILTDDELRLMNLTKLKNSQLQAALRVRDLSGSGIKRILVKRLTTYLASQQSGGSLSPKSVELLNELIIEGIENKTLHERDEWVGDIGKYIHKYLDIIKKTNNVLEAKLKDDTDTTRARYRVIIPANTRAVLNNLYELNRGLRRLVLEINKESNPYLLLQEHIKQNNHLYPRSDDYDKYNDKDEEQIGLDLTAPCAILEGGKLKYVRKYSKHRNRFNNSTHKIRSKKKIKSHSENRK